MAVPGAALVACTAMTAPGSGDRGPEPTSSLRNYVDEAKETSAAEASAAAAEQQADYAAAVADFPLTMPDGYEFPDTVPSDKGTAAWAWASGRMVAYAVWRCSVAQAARDAHVLDGDDATAEALLEEIRSVRRDELADNNDWVATVLPTEGISWGSLEGETGMCYFWLRPFGRWNV